MKKSCFKVLCMVLIIALLAPNAFAATPTPEAPLADAATVERVKQEIADGEITDMEDLFLVAYQHLGADLEEEGMTAYINEDGTLGIAYVVSPTENHARSGGSDDPILAVTSMLLVDDDGQPLSADEFIYSSFAEYGYASLDSVMMYATNTIGISIRYDGFARLDISLAYVKTTISYGLNAFSASRITQSYDTRQARGAMHYTGSQTLDIASAGTYTYQVGGAWYNPTSGSVDGYIKGSATIYVANSDLSFQVEAMHDFNVNYEYYLNLIGY